MSKYDWSWMEIDHRKLCGEPPATPDQDSGISLVALMYPCPRAWTLPGRTFWKCETDSLHGHIGLQCDDGTAIVPARIESRHFYDEVLMRLLSRSCLSRQEFSALWHIESAKRLLPGLTRTEYWTSMLDARITAALHYGYCGC